MAPANGRSDRGAGCGAEEAAANGALRRVIRIGTGGQARQQRQTQDAAI
jgi:hypothetical protein